MPLFDDAALRRQAMLQQMTPPAQVESVRSGNRIGWGPYAALEVGQGADLATTLAALQRGGRETHPLGAGGVMASKAALMALCPLLMRKLVASGHPTAAKIMGYGGGAAGAVPAAMNLHTMGTGR